MYASNILFCLDGAMLTVMMFELATCGGIMLGCEGGGTAPAGMGAVGAATI